MINIIERVKMSEIEATYLYLSLKIGLFGMFLGMICGAIAMREYLLTKFDLKRK